eukprot:SAG11_NODE_33345_length_277_cov_53.657303_1_plen_72_part_01
MTAYSGYGIVSYNSTAQMSEEPDDPDLMSLLGMAEPENPVLDMAEPEPELESLFREKYRETNPEIQAISRRV